QARRSSIPGKTQSRRDVVQIALTLTRDERLDDRIDLAGAALVVDLGIDLVAQPPIQLQSARYAPVVLNEAGDVRGVGVGQLERLRRLPTAQRDRKQEVVIVDAPVTGVIEGRKVFNKFDASLLEHTQV